MHEFCNSTDYIVIPSHVMIKKKGGSSIKQKQENKQQCHGEDLYLSNMFCPAYIVKGPNFFISFIICQVTVLAAEGTIHNTGTLLAAVIRKHEEAPALFLGFSRLFKGGKEIQPWIHTVTEKVNTFNKRYPLAYI